MIAKRLKKISVSDLGKNAIIFEDSEMNYYGLTKDDMINLDDMLIEGKENID